MKKIFSLFLALTLLAFVISPALALKPENKPKKSQGPHEKVTGEFTATTGSVGLFMKIEAHHTSPTVKGNISYSNTLGGYFDGVVDICYKQEDNKAIFGGYIISGGTYPQKYFYVEVIDNGEGENATGQDLVRVVPTNVKPVCIFTNSYPGKVIEGNIQVHKPIIEE